jgi:hypothetical protein
LCVSIIEIGFGLKTENPLNKVGFFRKEIKDQKPTKLSPEEVPKLSMLYTPSYLERSVKIFIKDDDTNIFNETKTAFTNYCNSVNKKCQEKFQEKGVNIIFEGRGGSTPSVYHAQN